MKLLKKRIIPVVLSVLMALSMYASVPLAASADTDAASPVAITALSDITNYAVDAIDISDAKIFEAGQEITDSQYPTSSGDYYKKIVFKNGAVINTSASSGIFTLGKANESFDVYIEGNLILKSPIDIKGNVTIHGEQNACIIDESNNNKAYSLIKTNATNSTLSINDLDIKNSSNRDPNSNEQYVIRAYASNSNLKLQNVNISNIEATESIIAIGKYVIPAAGFATADIRNVKIENTKSKNIILSENGVTTIDKCELSNNTASNSVLNAQSNNIKYDHELNVSDIDIHDNTSANGIYFLKAKAFANNTNGKTFKVSLYNGKINHKNAITYNEYFDKSEWLEQKSKITVTGKVKFEQEPEKDYYYITKDDVCYLSSYPEGTEGLHLMKTESSDGGALSVTPFNFIPEGTEVAVSAVPDAGYSLKKLYYKTASSEGQTNISKNDDGEYSFAMPTNDITVYAEFAQITPHKVLLAESENGSISLAEGQENTVSPGQTVSFNVKANEGFRLKKDGLTVSYSDDNGQAAYVDVTEGENGTYSFIMPDAEATVTAVFEELPVMSVNCENVEGGSIAVSVDSEEADKAQLGKTVTLTSSNEAGYVLKAIKVLTTGNEEIALTKSEDAVNVYTFTMPESDVTVNAEYLKIASSGTGTEADPYMISSVDELNAFSQAVNGGVSFEGSYLKLKNDIYLDDSDKTKNNWTPIGQYVWDKNESYYESFKGNFDGDGHTIGNIYISLNDKYQGFFGSVENAVIENLNITGYIDQATYAGGLCGTAYSSTFRNCSSSVSVQCNIYAGGLIGNLAGNSIVESCSSNSAGVSVAKGQVGGIIGIIGSSGVYGKLYTDDTDVTIKNCANYSPIGHNGAGGGILGSHASGNVEIIGCVNYGDNTGNISGGGIVGSADDKDTLKITDCYNTGNVSIGYQSGQNGTAGGIIGNIPKGGSVVITNCYFVGEAVIPGYREDYLASSSCYAGGIVGNIISGGSADVQNCYYVNDIDSKDGVVNISTLGTKVAPEELKALDAEKVKLDGYVTDASNINNGYPVLSWQSAAEYYTVTVVKSGDAANDVTVTVNNADYNDSGVKLLAGSILRISAAIDKDSKYKVDSISVGDTEYKTSQTSGSGKYVVSAEISTKGLADENGNITVNIVTRPKTEEEASKGNAGNISSTVPQSQVWDGKTLDLSWFDPSKYDNTDSYEISTPAQLEGLAALVNGLVNEDCTLYLWDGTKMSASAWNSSDYVNSAKNDSSGPNGQNKATEEYHYGKYDFKGKTISLKSDIDMGGIYDSSWSGPNYMPVGGQYLMKKNDYSTKISATFNGTFEGNGHYVFNIYCDRKCTTGNFGDGQSVGLIGRLGCHDSDPSDMRADEPGVYNVAVTGYINANRSVGGIVGKIGKTNNGGIISGCANYATIIGSDAKGTGGIVGAGWNGGKVENCYNMGSVTGGWPAGGIVGSNEIQIINCYNAGTVSSVSGNSYGMAIGTRNAGESYYVHNCYYLKDSASSGAGYFNKNSKADIAGSYEVRESDFMRSADFVSELGDGIFAADTSNINNGYPILKWQVPVPEKEKVESSKNAINNNAENINTDDPSANIEPDVSVNGKDALASVDKDDVDSAVKAVKGSAEEIVIDAVSGKKGIEKSEVTIPAASVKKIADDTKASLVIKTDAGDIKIANKDLSGVADGSGSDVTFTVEKNDDGSVKVSVKSDGKEITSEEPIIRVSFKADDKLMKSLAGKTGTDNSDLVAAIVKADKANEIVRKSIVSSDGTVTADVASGTAITVTANGKTFDDVDAQKWYVNAVGFAVSHELFDGISDTEFAPDKSMTRGMFVTVLNRLANAENFAGKADFSDVTADKWYATGTAWAAANKIVSGYGDGKFGPDDAVTREQMAVIMYNFTKAMGYDVTGSASLDKFSDSASVDSWAADAVKWAVGSGVMSGNADGTLNPLGTATRAQVATIMMNYTKALLGVK